MGGKSLLWARWTQRWSDLDFEANAKEGIAVDWPIRYDDIAPWYAYVEKFAGISGNADGIPHLPDGTFQPPMEMNCLEKHFKKSIESNYTGRHLIISRTANLTRGLKGRGPVSIAIFVQGGARMEVTLAVTRPLFRQRRLPAT